MKIKVKPKWVGNQVNLIPIECPKGLSDCDILWSTANTITGHLSRIGCCIYLKQEYYGDNDLKEDFEIECEVPNTVAFMAEK
jgi:hypothetical protein